MKWNLCSIGEQIRYQMYFQKLLSVSPMDQAIDHTGFTESISAVKHSCIENVKYLQKSLDGCTL